MNIEQALLEQVRTLTPDQQRAVLDFATAFHSQTPPKPLERTPGLHQEATYFMSDDFDGPLPDEFWLGKEV